MASSRTMAESAMASSDGEFDFSKNVCLFVSNFASHFACAAYNLSIPWLRFCERCGELFEICRVSGFLGREYLKGFVLG